MSLFMDHSASFIDTTIQFSVLDFKLCGPTTRQWCHQTFACLMTLMFTEVYIWVWR